MAENRTFRPRIEGLEGRITPSWTVPPSRVTVPTTFAAAALDAAGNASAAAAVDADEVDWYKFTVRAGNATFTAAAAGSSIDTVLAVYNSSGRRVAYNDDISAANSDSSLAVKLSAGTYYLGVTNYTGGPGGGYAWGIDAPSNPPADDAFENNDSRSAATSLGTPAGSQTTGNLVLADAADWFKITTTRTGAAGSGASIAFRNADGDLTLKLYNSGGSLLATSQGTGDTEAVSLAGRAAGTYYLQVTGVGGVYNPNYALTVTTADPPPPPPPPPPATSGFQITVRFTGGLTASQQAVFQTAADRWAQVITGDLPDATYNGIAVDDVLIDASGADIDGVGKILGSAGWDLRRSNAQGGLPIHGSMRFDSADLASMEQGGYLLPVILHEMGHVLGVGTLWSAKGFLSGAGTSNPTFTGPQAVAAYNQIFGTNVTGVPVENGGGSGTRDAHWRESAFDNEIMTGYINVGRANPLSRVTVASLADLGYTVNMAAADAYTPP